MQPTRGSWGGPAPRGRHAGALPEESESYEEVDTARIDFSVASTPASGRQDDEDTATTGIESTEPSPASVQAVHAMGVVRFYRARSSLDFSRGERLTITTVDSAMRAWAYLEALTPDALPQAVRRAFFELTYLGNHKLGSGDATNAEAIEFVEKLREIAAKLDELIDADVVDDSRPRPIIR